MSRHGDNDDDDDEGEGDLEEGEGTSDLSDETPPSPSPNHLPLNGNPSVAHPPCLHSLQQSELSSSEGIQVGTVSGLPMTGIVEMGLPIAGGQSTVHAQLDPMAHMAYPILDPYYCGLVASYGSPMFYQQMLGVQQVRRLLPSDMVEEEPVYVNAKQYHGIMRRRQSRAKAEMENKLVKSRKPYLHESRHLHAKRRARGCGGRFLKVKSDDDSKTSSRE